MIPQLKIQYRRCLALLNLSGGCCRRLETWSKAATSNVFSKLLRKHQGAPVLGL
jgi:hypothetical protein